MKNVLRIVHDLAKQLLITVLQQYLARFYGLQCTYFPTYLHYCVARNFLAPDSHHNML